MGEGKGVMSVIGPKKGEERADDGDEDPTVVADGERVDLRLGVRVGKAKPEPDRFNPVSAIEALPCARGLMVRRETGMRSGYAERWASDGFLLVDDGATAAGAPVACACDASSSSIVESLLATAVAEVTAVEGILS